MKSQQPIKQGSSTHLEGGGFSLKDQDAVLKSLGAYTLKELNMFYKDNSLV
jgi:hypothetical protein